MRYYNVKVKDGFQDTGCVVNDAGTVIHKNSFIPGEVDVMEWATEEMIERLKESREPLDAPTLPDYVKVQPSKPGKIFWFTGPPGAGNDLNILGLRIALVINPSPILWFNSSKNILFHNFILLDS